MLSVTFLRHCESTFNADMSSDTVDATLTEHGKQEAAKLSGHYDVVICSPLRRAMQTLDCSGITFTTRMNDALVREWVCNVSDMMVDEPFHVESYSQFLARVDRFLEYLRCWYGVVKSVLVVSHGDFIHEIGGVGLRNGEFLHGHFDRTSTRCITTMEFEDALRELKKGAMIQRVKWRDELDSLKIILITHTDGSHEFGVLPIQPLRSSWVPNMDDLFALDWMVV